MNERAVRMAQRYGTEDIFPVPVAVEFDRADLLLSDYARQAKRTAEYLLAQEVRIDDDDRMIGRFRFNGSIESDCFHRSGYKHYNYLLSQFYCKPFENLVTLDWQHTTADFSVVINEGLLSRIDAIAQSRRAHAGDEDAAAYLDALETVARAILKWAEKCACGCEQKAAETADEARKAELLEMARILRKVPAHPADTFREAMQCLYFCFQFLPDSLGTPDRYLYRCYRHDLDNGISTEEEMGELLQELYVMINASTPSQNSNADKGGETHFAIGGYTAEHEDGFTGLSKLILKSMMEVPVCRPQISFRWTAKTPSEVLYYVLDCERHDRFKRIALVNDEPRLPLFTEHMGLPYEKAVGYCMVGCNELALPGGMNYGHCEINLSRSLIRTLYDHAEDCIACRTFDEFLEVYRARFNEDMTRMMEIADGWSAYMAKDVDMVSSLFLNGPVEKAKTVTRGGCANAFAGHSMIGHVTVLDSLIVIRQFVFEEKRFTMAQLLDMLKADWQGYEDEHAFIYRTARYHGNDDPMAREVAAKFSQIIGDFFADKRDMFGYKLVMGNITGYQPHFVWFGKPSPATPDGRRAGESITYGSSQSCGRDRKGLTALLNSIADKDPARSDCGAHVANVMVDDVLIRDDNHFEKVVALVEGYFRRGGLQLQLNYVSPEELLAAQAEPEKHENLRVRFSGYSGYFTRLDPDTQREIIKRTVKTF